MSRLVSSILAARPFFDLAAALPLIGRTAPLLSRSGVDEISPIWPIPPSKINLL
jgi:hypothetical protein